MKSIVLDTNALLRFLLKDNPAQSKIVAETFEKAKKREIVVYLLSAVIIEAVYVLEKNYTFPRSDVRDILEGILKVSYIEIEHRNILGISLNLYHNTRSSFIDIFIFQYSKQYNFALLTFDKKLKNLSKIPV
ncbi:hypothetical protein A3D77_03870 [Candidatus Gottesmanbacteria bacterium RIFCSPHIGHO2_02_FULL_39_11]|uniref:PIN domain-containing protein n=1 Tax=Candidatus Gottesmanbacteria bacterium RIFCSPHIGHO2_02_FULL_39_11 TaxID=1798382 RepID=A0A1F5ZK59_9BACT|nr:MAG: hypothetical protein A3D77_03870 [Candidatus Gottesmanbacteria bacterium RIFCSPHIGHO2_02_FULL_39_11]